MINYIENNYNDPHVGKFRKIAAYKGPLISSYPNYKGLK